MKASYKRLWKLLIDKDKEERPKEKADISSFSIRKLNRGDNVMMDEDTAE